MVEIGTRGGNSPLRLRQPPNNRRTIQLVFINNCATSANRAFDNRVMRNHVALFRSRERVQPQKGPEFDSKTLQSRRNAFCSLAVAIFSLFALRWFIHLEIRWLVKSRKSRNRVRARHIFVRLTVKRPRPSFHSTPTSSIPSSREIKNMVYHRTTVKGPANDSTRKERYFE